MSAPIIRVENLSKKYRLGQVHKKLLSERLGDSLRHLLGRRQREAPHEDFWALRDVSFEINQGDVVGVIGRNGAGKSTLLKILSRITAPTRGWAEMYGRVASLLEVGTGFHPELTGRENIFLNGAILGMSKVEIRSKFDEIVAFAEIEKFIDTPVKRYSSGMYVRLAFAVAAHLEPEILIVDEVLAVGDIAFQVKCLGKMGDVARQGKTVLVVSHNMTSIRALCNRCILLERGLLAHDGNTIETVALYMNSGMAQENGTVDLTDHPRRLSGMAKVLKRISLLDVEGQTITCIHQDRDLFIRIEYQQTSEIRPSHVGFALYAQDGTRITGFNTAMGNCLADWRIPGSGIVTFRIPGKSLNPGQFILYPSIAALPNNLLDKVEGAISFSVEQSDIYGTGYVLTQEDGLFPLMSSFTVQPTNRFNEYASH